jgi:protein kinase A
MAESSTITTKLREIYKRKKDEFERKIQSVPSVSISTLDDYIISHTLGTGTFASVVLAKLKNQADTKQQYYAIKILRKRRVLECNQKDNILNEKKLLFAFDYPFLIKLENSFKDNSNLYMVLEYASGGEMFTHLRKKGRYSEAEARFYASQIVLAFEYLHFLKIIYRNLIPENVLFSQDGYIKLGDFGLAKIVEQGYTCTLCGTPEYLAPEIIAGRGYCKEVDWWACGVLVYEMVAGYPPFTNDDNIKTYSQIIQNNLEIPQSFSKNLGSLVSSFLQTHVSMRLGTKCDGYEVKLHEWFKGTDWRAIYEKRVTPPLRPNEEFDKSEYIRPDIGDNDQYGDEFANF